jgi:antitoxin (DNA-binding transcriptional repressor) of toxin-antitoxin stability system
MPIAQHPSISIAVTAFKSRCLAVIDDVAQGKTGPVVLLKRNRPVAAIVPIDDDPPDLWGAMRGSVTISPETDLTEATGELWDAEL